MTVVTLSATAAEEGRTKTRLLYSFEQAGEAENLAKRSENLDLITVQDNGVTDGKNCARLLLKRGGQWANLEFEPAAFANWRDFDYFAIDVWTEETAPHMFALELWDKLSKNYHTRCTFEGVTTHAGPQTLLYPINRAKRNGKEGRDWGELEPQDKIDLNGLNRVKIIFNCAKDRDLTFWIDNVRLMQEDAAKPKMKVPLPAGALAWDFGNAGATVPGFTAVPATAKFGAGEATCGFVDPAGLQIAGAGWPDLLTGAFVLPPDGKTLEFKARVPSGDYCFWLAAGKVVRSDLKDRRYLLAVNQQTLLDETPAPADFLGEKYLYRFLWTQYSEKPHAIWENYINVMYPALTGKVTVADGTLTVRAANHFLGGLILLPAPQQAAFDTLCAQLRELRSASFEKTYFAPARTKPKKEAGDAAYVLYVPDSWRGVGPDTGPTAAERARRTLTAAGAPDQNVILRVAVVPFADLGACELQLSDLQGPATIPASAIRGHFANYRAAGQHVGEMVLLPRLTLQGEAGVTQCFWLWLRVPADAKPGEYRGEFTFKPGTGAPTKLPVTLTVHPFKLMADLPAAFGMYYREPYAPSVAADRRAAVLLEQFRWMRTVGLNTVTVTSPTVTGIGGGKTSMTFDPTAYEAARAAGMARRPEQELMATALGVGRAIGRRLPGSQGAKVDQNPGIELRQPEFRALFVDAMRQYSDFIKKLALPVAVEVVDEPREVPNPWNRNLADTIAYADMIHAGGPIRTFVTPMGDTGSGKDYVPLAEHVDIVSTHATKGSARFMARTKELGKTLWLYNSGMDRLSWGFYNWRVGSRGRWEWHFCWGDDGAVGGYPGREWYNPFTSMHGFAPNAPLDRFPAGLLYQSLFLQVADGITDYAYLCTLEEALKAAEKNAAKAATVAEAKAFLAALQRAIPELPGVKGLATPEDGALVGMGIEDAAVQHLDDWRAKLASFLTTLTK